MSPTLDYVYRYAQPSALLAEPGAERLFLATTAAPAASPLFFQGSLRRPRRTADLLLALHRVVRSRFHIPAAMLNRILAESDPVVTCSEDRIRFEGFSSCCSAYARVDLLPEAVDGSLLGHGTTNVDFNPPMRAALAGLRDHEPVRLSVGATEVEIRSEAGAAVERKVPLPVRWLKGFVEAQAHQSRMSLRLEVDGAEARRFLRGLPRSGSHGKPAFTVPAGRGLRVSQVKARDAVRVAGLERLLILDEIARHARGMRVYAGETTDASAWELLLPDARFLLALSPEVWRGFSGEGQALTSLADSEAEEAAGRVRGALRWQTRLDADAVARECGLDRRRALLGLAALGASGIVGYDLADGGAYFHRELPFDYTQVEALNPRLKDARKLVAEGAVQVERQGAEGVEAWVRSADLEHRVRLTPDGDRCTCPWYGKHQGERGPCKHVLAVQIALGEDE